MFNRTLFYLILVYSYVFEVADHEYNIIFDNRGACLGTWITFYSGHLDNVGKGKSITVCQP